MTTEENREFLRNIEPISTELSSLMKWRLDQSQKILWEIFNYEPTQEQKDKAVDKFLKMLRDAKTK